MDEQNLLPGMEAAIEQACAKDVPRAEGPPRLRRPDRSQAEFRPCVLDELLEDDHPARTIWAVVQKLDLIRFHQAIAARGSSPGRAATDPALLIALWLYATTRGLANARELERLCRTHDAYRWICGGVKVNHHTLSDSRSDHATLIDDLFTQVLALLMHKGLVQIRRISQDGTRVRASAGSSSFRREKTLKMLEAEAREHIEELKAMADDPSLSARQAAAQRRAAEERKRRIDEAISQLLGLQEAKAAQKQKPSKQREPRVSTTDPQARVMRMGDGGFRPAYNVQFASDTDSRAIVGVAVSNSGTDVNHATPMRQQVEERTGGNVSEHLLDGGYVGLANIDQAAAEGVTIYAPPPMSRKADVDPHQPRDGDSDAVIQWRQRMAEPSAKDIYKERAATSETINADVKTLRGLERLRVRGLSKVFCAALWSALAYNVFDFGQQLVG